MLEVAQQSQTHAQLPMRTEQSQPQLMAGNEALGQAQRLRRKNLNSLSMTQNRQGVVKSKLQSSGENPYRPRVGDVTGHLEEISRAAATLARGNIASTQSTKRPLAESYHRQSQSTAGTGSATRA